MTSWYLFHSGPPGNTYKSQDISSTHNFHKKKKHKNKPAETLAVKHNENIYVRFSLTDFVSGPWLTTKRRRIQITAFYRYTINMTTFWKKAPLWHPFDLHSLNHSIARSLIKTLTRSDFKSSYCFCCVFVYLIVCLIICFSDYLFRYLSISMDSLTL